MAEPNKMLEETANYLLNHCFVLGGVEDQRAKYLYVQDHLPEVRAVFAPLGYAVTLYPAPLQAAALVNEHEGSQARLLKYESILLLVLRLLYLQKRESLAASADQVLVTVEEVQTELQKMNLPRRLDQRTLEELMRTLRRYNLARPVGRLTGLDSRIEVFPTVLLALPDADLADAAADILCSVLSLCGSYADTLAKAAALCRNDAMRAAVAELEALAVPLEKAGGVIRLDMTLAGEMEYYNGLVFQGYLKALPRPLLKGGRYDLLMQKFTPGAGAIGFAVYLDELDRLSAPTPPVQRNSAGRVMLNVALPKGRLGDRMYDLLARIGYGCPEDYNATRKLVVENPAAGIRYFLVKPSDVAIYVEHGAADVGIVGKDILTEASADVYELLDTGLGRCRMCVAAPADYKDDPSRPVRVATKFVNIAKSYYASIGRDIDIIKLNGSIELAPILGLSDVIVDIVETGTTLRENGLRVVTEFMPISARFIANKASYQFKHNEMDAMLEALRKTLQEETK